MSLWSRITNTFRGDRLSREIEEELQAHIEDAIAGGRDPAEARRAFGPVLQRGEESRDIRLLTWLEWLRADVVYGWRQILKRKVTSGAAVLSLALAMGASIAAFRLIDALLLRSLPVAAPEQLHVLSRQGIGFTGKPQTFDGWAYPDFRLMRAAAKGKAELIAVSYAHRQDLSYPPQSEIEKACVQYVSGWMFDSFGLRPALGRLFTENDDRTPGAHPYAVLSYDYWSRRFTRDPKVIGRKFQMQNTLFEIVGVAPQPFTGTETGTITDVFLPTMMFANVVRDDYTWHRTLARVAPGVAIEPLRATLDAVSRGFERERAKGFTNMPKDVLEHFLNQKLILQPAAAGISELQVVYRVGLLALGVLVVLVLLIACANVANLMTAQAAARAREMALRVSIGAGRWRLVQLTMVESALLALLATTIGAAFAWWAAPQVAARIAPPSNPVRLVLPADGRVLAFGAGLALLVTLLLGLAPALRASNVRPAAALKGGEAPHARRRLMQGLIGAQAAFCILVLFGAGLFAASFERLSHYPLRFSPGRVLTMTVIPSRAQSPVVWEQVAEHLRTVPGVERVALAGWSLLAGDSMNSFVSIEGAPAGPELAYFLPVSPGWLDTMGIALLEGRDFRPEETAPGTAFVNQTFVRHFLQGRRPLGTSFARGKSVYRIAGVVPDSPYRSLHEPTLPVAYIPFRSVDADGALRLMPSAAIVVRTASENPLALASRVRREVTLARADFRVSEIGAQSELVRSQSIRERLLAILSMFFALVALALAGIGLYGVLDYSVIARRREIGIRMAVGARPGQIARSVTAQCFLMVAAGVVAGLAVGLDSAHYIEGLLYQTRAGDPAMLALPALAIMAVALAAAVPAVLRAVRLDPAAMLRSD